MWETDMTVVISSLLTHSGMATISDLPKEARFQADRGGQREGEEKL